MDLTPISPLPCSERPIVRINGQILTSKNIPTIEPIPSELTYHSNFYLPALFSLPMLLQATWKEYTVKGIDGVIWACNVIETGLYFVLILIGGNLCVKIFKCFKTKGD